MSRWRRLRRAALWTTFAAGLLLAGERLLGVLWPYPLAQLAALPVSTVVTAADGTWLRVTPTPAGERVLPLSWNEAPAALRQLVLAAEDERFLEHGGVDALALLRAGATNLEAQRVVSGASTLTMQLVRIVEPRPRTFASKLIELVRSRQLERLCSKPQIGSLWLTQVPMGGTVRGFAAAAQVWFGRPLSELDLAELAALVAMVPAPSARRPDRRPALLRARRDALLRRAAERGFVGAAAAAQAITQELGMTRHSWPWLAPHLCDLALQSAPVLPSLPALSSPAAHANIEAEAVVPLLRTACVLPLQQRLSALLQHESLPGDGVAIVVLRRIDGAPMALLGDRDERAPLDLTRRRRSAGSTWKPFLYALAHAQGAIGRHQLFDDLPRSYDDWQPANFDRRCRGRTSAADALASSSNVVAVRCLEQVGPDAFAAVLQRLGLCAADGALHLDAALGTAAVTPLQLARAYWRFVERPQSAGLTPAAVEWALAAMRRLPLVAGTSRAGDVAWKSGTSSGRRDAWCVGVADRAIVVVWLGNRDGRGLADLVGVRTGNRLLAAVLAAL